MVGRIIILAGAIGLAGCAQPNGHTYTLYRSSATGPMRIHVATFDADQSEEYNRDNCQTARDLFAAQPGVKVPYWCEKGRYRA